jgi:uncharacterized protein (DUF1810 family)
MNSPDPFDLARFIWAQEGAYEHVVQELRSGRKRSHWMWFVFPQVEGLGHSPTARRYAIRSLAEARAYREHPVLGARLVECTRIVNGLRGLSAHAIFGYPDDLKFCSSMTLFERVAGAGSDFSTALDRYYGGRRDAVTLRLLEPDAGG